MLNLLFVLKALLYAGNPREGDGFVDQYRTYLLLALMALAFAAAYFGLYEAPDGFYDTALGAVLTSLGVDASHYDDES